MKIHYSTPSWHGGFHEFMLKAFRSLGHEVIYFDDNGTKGQKWFKRIFTRIPRRQYDADDRFREMVSRDWKKSVFAAKPDLVILEHVPNILASAIGEVRKAGYKIFYWVDSPAAGSQAKDLLAGLKFADEIFTSDPTKEFMSNLFHPSQYHFLPVGGDPDIYHPIAGCKKEYDVVFVGSFSPQTGDGVIRSEIMTNISKKYKTAVFGNYADYWSRFYPGLRDLIVSSKPLPASEVNEIYNKSKIVLGIYTTFHYDMVSGRTHEAALAGAFQIVDWRSGLDKLYPQGLISRYNYVREINGLIDYWIERPEERERIAAKAREHALANNTWRHRAEEMLGYFKK